ncbi:MAG TPA: hypothetical protein VFR85_13885 [Anaeromyxobacteraceae bacterium]|nr:hypothetical protein [Anaeromyxobacteraceae bacterium]
MTAWLAALALAASGDAAITWTPLRPVLGKTAQITVRVRLPGAAPDTPAPRLRASEGILGDPRRTAPDEWSATLDLPAGGPPLLALVSAVVEEPGAEPRVAFAAVPLRGRAAVPVETEPGARVRVELEGESFGPFTADERGRAEAVLDVPPGAATARVTVTGPGGRSQRLVKLPAMPAGRIAVEAVPAGPGRLRLEILVAGGARPGDVVLEADGAKVSPPRPLPGHPDRLTAYAEGRAGRVRIRAWLRGAELFRDEVSAVIAPPPPARPAPARGQPAAAGEERVQLAAPMPARTAAFGAGYRAQPGRTGGAEMALSLAWPLGRGGGVVLGASGLFFAHGAGSPGASSALEAGVAPEGMLLAEIPGGTLLVAVGPTLEIACHFAPAAGDACAAALGVSARLALSWRLPAPGESWLTAEGGLREIVAGGGQAREAGLAGGLGAAVGLRLAWP